ncbi:MAG TPA: hypothetical protein PKL30_23745 [Leptospiraceae bacterium]|nr:hypothetical protein [Leptospiraceae bacterium]HMW08707.1 hypothetical protein [Leptospiraceae bacterium]HMX35127.1 hypothetical protein [Leptospiraceae bacterium]HMY34421.1 hypothetical protein [Leptospiraceae bacterium]HMZ66842.1 hypothetical protein [Leptospiraceae bacterium]
MREYPKEYKIESVKLYLANGRQLNFTPFSSKPLFMKDSQSFFDLSHSLVR